MHLEPFSVKPGVYQLELESFDAETNDKAAETIDTVTVTIHDCSINQYESEIAHILDLNPISLSVMAGKAGFDSFSFKS